MSKHKTRQQKIISDLHRKLQLQSSSHSSEIDTVSKPNHVQFSYSHALHTSSKTKPLIMNLSYVKHDLYKTVFVTFTIIAAQLLLLYLLKAHLIILPIVSY